MKKIIISTLLIIVFAGYTLHKKFGRGDDDVPVVVPNSSDSSFSDAGGNTDTNPTPSTSSTNNPNTTPTTPKNTTPPTQPQPTTPKGQYVDGSYTGPITDAFYGPVQVKAVVSGGKLASVEWIQYPNDRSESRQINSIAMPYLSKEAVSAQSGSVNIISGATQTSIAFRKSLASALNSAKS